MLRSVQVGGDEEALVLCEELRSPLGTERIGGVNEAICDGTAVGQKERADFVLTVSCFDSRAGGEPISCAAFDCPGVPANRVSNHETFIGVAVQILAICEEVIGAKVFNQALGTDGFDA